MTRESIQFSYVYVAAFDFHIFDVVRCNDAHNIASRLLKEVSSRITKKK